MSLPEIDLENLPEPIRNLMQNIDLNALTQLASSMDANTALEFMNSALEVLKQSMRPQDMAILDQLLQYLVKSMQEQNK